LNFLKLRKYLNKNFEWIALAAGLFLLAIMSPYDSGQSFCLLESAGYDFCPGDGLGHSIAFFFRGEFQNSLQAHFMGIPAVMILSTRVLFLLNKNFNQNERIPDGKSD
jgi:hypothetical protein